MSLPERLGKYPITGVLGKGAMGIVYRGQDPVIRRPVAIKTIRKELIDDEDNAQHLSMRFRTEAQAAGALSHPGIVAVYEYGEDEKFAYIAMEYVEGNSLRDYLVRGTRFDEADTVSLMDQLLAALGYAHERGVWHRDIKPANIIVMSNGRIKLTDFGVARIESGDRTKTNVIMGTPGYIAPEIYLGEPADHRIDIFAAGVLMYQLLAQQPPFRGRPEAVMHDVCYHDPSPPSEVEGGQHWPQYDEVVMRALQKSPPARYASAAAFRAALLAAHALPANSTIAETTIISPLHRATPAVSVVGVVSPSSRPEPQPTTSAPPPTGWDLQELARVEKALARHLGPVARVLVRRAARVHKTAAALVAALQPSLNAPGDREAFAREVLGLHGTVTQPPVAATSPPASRGGAPAAGAPLTPEDVQRATRLLTLYIGPIAKVVVRRAASRATREEFLDEIARSLETEAQRERFLREATLPGA